MLICGQGLLNYWLAVVPVDFKSTICSLHSNCPLRWRGNLLGSRLLYKTYYLNKGMCTSKIVTSRSGGKEWHDTLLAIFRSTIRPTLIPVKLVRNGFTFLYFIFIHLNPSASRLQLLGGQSLQKFRTLILSSQRPRFKF